MELPHNCYVTTQPISGCIQAATNDKSIEVDLAASRHFFDYEGDWDVSDRYSEYFEDIKIQICEILGDPIYSGLWDDPNRSEWDQILSEGVDAVELAVWMHEDSKLYLRLGWEDKEIPIIIAIGIEGAEPNYTEYPGQF